MPPKPKRTKRTVAGATGGTTAPTTTRAAAAAKQSSTNSRATTTAAGKQATTSLKQKSTNAAGVTGTNTTIPSNQKGGISATAAIAAAIGATTDAPTKQKGGVTTDSNDPGRSERMPTRVARRQQCFCEVNKHIEMQLVRLTDTSNFFLSEVIEQWFFGEVNKHKKM
jgi:hypothetical protein